MPQLDYTTYSSQVFWFIICFIFLYYYISELIIPRIKHITSNRSRLISLETNNAFKLEQQISKLKDQSEGFRRESAITYKKKIEEAEKKVLEDKQKALGDLKQKIEVMTNNSRQEIIKFMTHSEQQKEEIVAEFIKSIKTKILN